MSEGPLALIYLARGADGGIEATNAFLASYRDHPAGTPHRLIVLTKGWADTAALAQVDQQVQAIGGETWPLPDDGFDLGAYFRAITRIKQPHVCFLNTHSRIISTGWLAKLYAAVQTPGTGAAGAAGSWQSVLDTEVLRWRREGLAYKLRHIRRIVRSAIRYPAFPNAALRTNAFVIARDVFADFAKTHTIPQRRDQVGLLESGRRGLTAYLAQRGLSVVVVGADGKTYAPAEWARSGTFVSPGQPNLMVSDNRTRIYETADARARGELEKLVWGNGVMKRSVRL